MKVTGISLLIIGIVPSLLYYGVILANAILIGQRFVSFELSDEYEFLLGYNTPNPNEFGYLILSAIPLWITIGMSLCGTILILLGSLSHKKNESQ